jgi:hypothetical protein
MTSDSPSEGAPSEPALYLRNADRVYTASILGQYFVGLNESWRACLRISVVPLTEQLAARIAFNPPPVKVSDSLMSQILDDVIAAEWTSSEGFPDKKVIATRIQTILGRRQYRRLYLTEAHRVEAAEWLAEFIPAMAIVRDAAREAEVARDLKIRLLRIQSPMEVALSATSTLGGVGVTAYAIHLLGKVLKEPEAVAAWLPRLVTSWHKGQSDVANAKLERLVSEETLKRSIRALETSSTAMPLKPDVVIPTNVRPDPPALGD